MEWPLVNTHAFVNTCGPLSAGFRRPSAREWAAETTNDRRALRRRVTLLFGDGLRTEHHASASPAGHTVDSRMCQQICSDPERGEPRQSPRRSTSTPGATFATDQTINPDARRHRDARGTDCTLELRWTCPSRSSGTRSTGTNTVGAVAVTPACPHVDHDDVDGRHLQACAAHRAPAPAEPLGECLVDQGQRARPAARWSASPNARPTTNRMHRTRR